MTFEEFDEKYDPIIRDNDSIHWETYGEDLFIVLSYPSNRVWTCVEAECDLYLIPGVRLVYSMFFIICNNEWTDENEKVEYWKEDEMVV